MNHSEELQLHHRKVDSAGLQRRNNKSPNVDVTDRKYMHCVRPAAELTRKRKLSGGKNSESLRICDSQSNSKRNVLRQDLKEIYEELISLKSEYRSLKQNYNTLLQEKVSHTEQVQALTEKMELVSAENLKLKKESERSKIQQEMQQQELQRTKREHGKLLEIETFRNKKLQETLLEKGTHSAKLENIISVLKAQLGFETLDENTLDTYDKANQEQYEPNSSHISFKKSSQVCEEQPNNKFMLTSISSGRKRIMQVLSDDSLTFSKEKSYMESSKLIVSPRQGCPDLLKDEPEDECRFYPLEDRIFKKRMQQYVEEDSFDATQNITELTNGNSPDVAFKKRSTTFVEPVKKKRLARPEEEPHSKRLASRPATTAEHKKRKKKSDTTNKQTDRLERSSGADKHTYR